MNQIAHVNTLPEHISPLPMAPTVRRDFGVVNPERNRGWYHSATTLAKVSYRKSALLIKVFGSLESLLPWSEGWFSAGDNASDLASKETKRLAGEVHRAFGIKGFVLNLAGSSSLTVALPACWDALRPCLESPELEHAAARIHTEALRLAEELGAAPAQSSLRLSREEASYLQAGLDFYHFFLPKMLVLTSALRLACDRERMKRGTMKKTELQKTVTEEDGLHGLFQDIRRILPLSGFQGSLDTPRAWSKYLGAASARLMPVVHGENYSRASNQLRSISILGGPGFQNQIDSVLLGGLEEDISEQVTKLETQLPSLIISITLLELYFRPADKTNSTGPVPTKSPPEASPKTTSERRGTYPSAVGLADGHVVIGL